MTVFVVLALTSLSSVAMAAPEAAPVCIETSMGHFDQYAAAIRWAEQDGVSVPLALTVSCEEENQNVDTSYADLGGDSGERFAQYLAASGGNTVGNGRRTSVSGFEQYLAAIKWAEQGDAQMPSALTVGSGEASQNLTAPRSDLGGESGERFKQYMEAIQSTAQ